MNHNRTTTDHLAAFVTIPIWGTTFISTKVLLRTLSPVEILFIRFVMGYPALWLAYPRFLRPTSVRQERLCAATGFCGVTIYYLLENIALTCILASNVGVIISIVPFFTAILNWMFLGGKRPRSRFLIGLPSAMTGVSSINFGNRAALSLNPTGDLLVVAAAVIWTMYSILTKETSTLGRDTVWSARRTLFYGILFMVSVLVFMDFYMTPTQLTDMKNILNPLFLGPGVPVLYFVTWNTGVKILDPIKTSVYIYVVSVTTTLTSVLILKEPVIIPAALGITTTLIGLFLSKQKTTREGEPKIQTTKIKNV